MTVQDLIVIALLVIIPLLGIIIGLLLSVRSMLRAVLLKSRLEAYEQTRRELEFMKQHIPPPNEN